MSCGPPGTPRRELVLLPARDHGRLVERMDGALVVGDEQVAIIGRETIHGSKVA